MKDGRGRRRRERRGGREGRRRIGKRRRDRKRRRIGQRRKSNGEGGGREL